MIFNPLLSFVLQDLNNKDNNYSCKVLLLCSMCLFITINFISCFSDFSLKYYRKHLLWKTYTGLQYCAVAPPDKGVANICAPDEPQVIQ